MTRPRDSSVKTWILLTTDWKLLLAIAGMLLLAGYLYYSSRPEPQLLAQEVHRVVASLEKQHNLQIPDRDSLVDYLVAELAAWESHTFGQRLRQHTALALLVSVILLVTVEWHTRTQIRREVQAYRDQVGRDVWSAVSGRLVKEPIAREIDDILKSEIVRHECDYTLTFMTYPGLPSDYIVLKREVTYKLRNLTNKQGYRFPLMSSILSSVPDITCKDQEGNDIVLPGHRQFCEDGKQVDLSKALMPEDKRCIRYEVELPKDYDQFVEIYLDSDEVVTRTGANSYTFVSPTIDLEVTVHNRIPDQIKLTGVYIHHSLSPYSVLT